MLSYPDDLHGIRTAQHAGQIARLGGRLHRPTDFVIAGTLVEFDGQIDDRHVGRRHPERHAGQFAIQLRQNHTYGLSYWLPFYGTGYNPSNGAGWGWGTGDVSYAPYIRRSNMCPANIGCFDFRLEVDDDLIRKLYGRAESIELPVRGRRI